MRTRSLNAGYRGHGELHDGHASRPQVVRAHARRTEAADARIEPRAVQRLGYLRHLPLAAA